ncbi:MAG: hypothetical protein WBB28_11245 [Crinalium sp.]
MNVDSECFALSKASQRAYFITAITSDRIDIDTLNSNLSIALLMSLEKVRSSLSVRTYNLI